MDNAQLFDKLLKFAIDNSTVQRDRYFTIEKFISHANINESSAIFIVNRLISDQYILRLDRTSRPQYCITIQGEQFYNDGGYEQMQAMHDLERARKENERALKAQVDTTLIEANKSTVRTNKRSTLFTIISLIIAAASLFVAIYAIRASGGYENRIDRLEQQFDSLEAK